MLLLQKIAKFYVMFVSTVYHKKKLTTCDEKQFKFRGTVSESTTIFKETRQAMYV